MMTATERVTVVSAFTNRDDAQRAVNELRQAGFRNEEIGIATRNGPAAAGALAVEDQGDRVASAATAGALAGGAGGALWGIAIAAGLLPGIGPVIAGGTLSAILASAATGAAAAGLAGALIGLGLPENEAEHYQSEFNAGRTIVTVHAAGERYQQAQDVLNRAGSTPAPRLDLARVTQLQLGRPTV
jgi:hypothetical protein